MWEDMWVYPHLYLLALREGLESDSGTLDDSQVLFSVTCVRGLLYRR